MLRYKTVAVQQQRICVSRHGISKSQGGQYAGGGSWVWPDTPVEIAIAIERDNYPGCKILIEWIDNPTGDERCGNSAWV